VFLLLFVSTSCLVGYADDSLIAFQVLQSYPHDPTAYTQGLVYHGGYLYESTGLYGESSLRKVELETGNVIKKIDIADRYFAEGIEVYQGSIYLLTWQAQIGFIHDLNSFQQTGTFSYPTQGWGLTHDGQQMIMSDGSATLRFYDPTSWRETRQVVVKDGGQPVSALNELEFIESAIFANVFQSNRVARIQPETGEVTGWLDLSVLVPEEADLDPFTDVLNGIAYDAEKGRIFITGKRWPVLYAIELLNPSERTGWENF
jgi:glutamine cyclotransferase